MNLRRLLPRLGLALLLVASQQVGAVHRLGHAMEQLAGLAQEGACSACLALAGIDAPAVGDVCAEPAAIAEAAAPQAARSGVAGMGGAPCAYRSRAPPLQV